MNIKKIGSFLAEERKAKNLTQAALAQKLYVSEKTISKWENGRSLPDTSLLLVLCSVFDVSLNELLSGERLKKNDYTEYKVNAEDNMTKLLAQRKNNKHKILFSALCFTATYSVMLIFILLSAFFALPSWLKISLISYGFLLTLFGLAIAVFYDINTGSFECKYCGKKFIPTAKAYCLGYHTFRKRRLKCPYCGKTSMCRKTLQNQDE